MSLLPEQLRRFRSQTTGVRFVTHFNNAGSSLPPDPVLEEVRRYLENEHRLGGYEWMAKEASHLQQVYESVGSLIGANSDHIALMESATQGWYKAFRSLDWKPGDVVLTAEAAYGSNFIGYLQAKKQLGIEIRIAPSLESGELDVEAMSNLIDGRVKLIALTHIPTHNGLVNPAEAVGKLARAHHIPYLLDACQSVGHMPLDVRDLQCDFLSATGRKYLRAPRGTGFLYVHPRMWDRVEPPFPDLTSAEWVAEDRYEYRRGAKRFENFEANRALRMGLGRAARYAQEAGIGNTWQYIQQLASGLREGLRSLPGISVHDRGSLQSGIVTFSHNRKSANEIQHFLGKKYINVSVAFPGAALLDMQRRGYGRMVRASVHYYNSEDEVQQLLEAVAEATA